MTQRFWIPDIDKKTDFAAWGRKGGQSHDGITKKPLTTKFTQKSK